MFGIKYVREETVNAQIQNQQSNNPNNPNNPTITNHTSLRNMEMLSPVDFTQRLEQFRHLLFHLQMECGSVHELLRFFKEEDDQQHFEALKAHDPNLMTQLLAREYVLEARRADTPQTARQHLEQALRLDARCPEACLELATLSDSPEGMMKWFQKSMDATSALLGEERMTQLLTQFCENPWEQLETRTWFKAKIGLAETLFRNGFYEVAILNFRELLRFDQADLLGLRHYLMVSFLCENRLDEASDLAKQFPDDDSAANFYCRAILRFKQEGDTRRSRRSLLRAFRRNLWTPMYLLGLAEMPPEDPSAAGRPFREGSQGEAADCVRCMAPAFLEDAKLLWWTGEVLKSLD